MDLLQFFFVNLIFFFNLDNLIFGCEGFKFCLSFFFLKIIECAN